MKYIVIATHRTGYIWYLQNLTSHPKPWNRSIKFAMLFEKETAQEQKESCEDLYRHLDYVFYVEIAPKKEVDLYEDYDRAMGVI